MNDVKKLTEMEGEEVRYVYESESGETWQVMAPSFGVKRIVLYNEDSLDGPISFLHVECHSGEVIRAPAHRFEIHFAAKQDSASEMEDE